MAKYLSTNSNPRSNSSIILSNSQMADAGMSDEDDSDGARGVGGQGSSNGKIKQSLIEIHPVFI